MSKSISVAEVAEHKNADSGMYIIIDSNVYDITSKIMFSLKYNQVQAFVLTAFIDFIDEHPGGAKILKRVAGKDATKQFWKYHNESVLKKYSPQLMIGTVAEKAKL
jgi:cytochrome b involved in lipid metabolism